MWYGNSSNQDCKALQRVVRLAERISGSALSSLQDIYLKRCKSRAAKIRDSTHPGNHLFCLLPSGRRYRSMMAKTERLRRSFFLNCTFYFIAHFTPYFYFILTYIYIYSLVLCFICYFFALSIERTCPDSHFTTDYIQYN